MSLFHIPEYTFILHIVRYNNLYHARLTVSDFLSSVSEVEADNEINAETKAIISICCQIVAQSIPDAIIETSYPFYYLYNSGVLIEDKDFIEYFGLERGFRELRKYISEHNLQVRFETHGGKGVLAEINSLMQHTRLLNEKQPKKNKQVEMDFSAENEAAVEVLRAAERKRVKEERDKLKIKFINGVMVLPERTEKTPSVTFSNANDLAEFEKRFKQVGYKETKVNYNAEIIEDITIEGDISPELMPDAPY